MRSKLNKRQSHYIYARKKVNKMQNQTFTQFQTVAIEEKSHKSKLKIVFILIAVAIAVLAVAAACILLFKQKNSITILDSGWQIVEDKRSDENIIALAVQVENTSKDKYASNIEIAAEVYDNGKEVASIIDACIIEYLAPNDKAYCASNVIQESNYNITDIAFTINGKNIKYENYNTNEHTNSKSFEVSNINVDDTENILCTIQNNSGLAVKNPKATIVFYKGGKIIGGASGELEQEELPANTSTDIQFYGNLIKEYDEYKISVTGI